MTTRQVLWFVARLAVLLALVAGVLWLAAGTGSG